MVLGIISRVQTPKGRSGPSLPHAFLESKLFLKLKVSVTAIMDYYLGCPLVFHMSVGPNLICILEPQEKCKEYG